MRIHFVWVVMSILLFLCACGVETRDAPATSELFSSERDSVPKNDMENHDENASESHSELIAFMHLNLPEFLDEELFALEGIAEDYVRMDYGQFCNTYDFEQLYAYGIIDTASFIIGETRFENVVGGSTLVFTARYANPVAGEIGVGATIALVRDRFGDPGFSNKEYNLIGYKTQAFYIAFSGTETAEYIYLSRRYPQTETDDLLPQFYKAEEKGSFPFDEWNMESTQLWRASMTHFSPSGLCIWSGYDDDFNDFYPAFVYNDYEGQIPKIAPEESDIIFTNIDYPEHKILSAYREEALIQSNLAAGLESEYYSPNKRIAILPFIECTYERSGYLLRYLDNSAPDRFLSFGHFPGTPIWLNDHYICVNTMYGFGIYDVNSGGSYRVDSPFYIDDATYGGLWVVDPVQQCDSLVIRGEEMVIHHDGKDATLVLKQDEQLVLKFHYDANDKLAVEYIVEKQQ